jgi:hypothetical protein
MKVLIAVLHCDRKAHNQLFSLDSIYHQDFNDYAVYHNVETEDMRNFFALMDIVREYPVKTYYDFWNYDSTWWKQPVYDQDQARLVPICEARNRSIECAIDLQAENLLFVDADMQIPLDTITRLLARDKDLVGGYVRGRNDHKGAEYIFGHVNGIQDLGNGLIECDHGNIGFVMIKRKVFEVLRFRRGRHCTLGHLQSDDPNYCFDWLEMWHGERFYVDKNVQAIHKDETKIPFFQGAQY